jgi:3-hydroxy acid dehydrogenase / malonic semialdehyde reductase
MPDSASHPPDSPLRPLQDRHAVITGASAGIGRSCAEAFAREGAHLTLAARRQGRLDEIKEELSRRYGVRVEVGKVDVRDPSQVDRFVERTLEDSGPPDVLVNNAGLSRGLSPLHEGEVRDWEEMIDTNVKGLLYMTRGFLPAMVERDAGHVVNLGSIAGHIVYPGGNVYNASKFAVRALSEGLNMDLVGTRIRVSSVDPGLVETEFSRVRFRGDESRARGVYEGYTPLSPDDVAEVVRYVTSAPPHVNIFQTVIYPTDQRSPFVLHRRSDPETVEDQ